MALTAAQYTALATDINSNANVATYLASGADGMIAAYYNTASTFIVWRNDVGIAEIQRQMVWAEMAALSQGALQSWNLLTQTQQTLDASNTNIRTGFSQAFGSGSTTLANLLVIAKRPATNAEKLFSTGTGTNANPGVLGTQGNLVITHWDIAHALRGAN